MKKIASFTALLFFLAAPLAYAYDFGAAGIVAAVGGAGAGLALVFGAPAALGTVAIGALVAGLQFMSPNPSPEQVPQVDVQLSPGAKLPTPPGWVDPAAGQTDPSPPPSSVAQSLTKWTMYGCTNLQTGCGFEMFDSAAQFAAYDCSRRSEPAPINGTYTTPTIYQYKCGQYSYTYQTSQYTAKTCPSGYNLTGDNCTLANPANVMKPSDDKCTIKRSGNSFSVDPRDPDCVTGKIPASTAVQPNSITTTGADGSTKSLTINADGSATAQESRPNNSNNTTETNTTTFSPPDASGAVKVTGQGSGVAPGTGTQAGTSTPPVNVNFDKAGLATEGTLTGIKTDTAAIKDALSPKDVDTSLGDQKSALDTAMDGLAALFGAEPSKSAVIEDDFSIGGFLPAQCGCSPLTMTILGKTASYNWCGPMETFKGVFSWVIGLLTALYVLSLFRLGGGK